MKRREDRTAHSAQVSFPGGKAEPEDADMLATALREANEELGIDPHQLQILGALTSLYIPVSNFNVFPYVAYMPSRPQYIVNRAEVAYPIETFVSHLLSDDNKVITDVSSPAVPDKIRQVKAYKLDDGTIVWGATAMIISELETAIKEYNQGSI